jgi:rhodanese-related sulfurtransferase
MTQESLKELVQSANTPVLFYCNGARCMRSHNAATMAISWGYKNIYWFRGGWGEWLDKELPVSRL